MSRALLIGGAVCLWLAMADRAQAQFGYVLVGNSKSVEIPFEYANNFIILSVRFGGVLPLKFIFDTGAEHTIITKREITDLLGMRYEREFRIAGSDLHSVLIAHLVRRVRFDIPGKAYSESEDVLVLQEDYLRFEEFTGIPVHGILSAHAFSRFIIQINYDRQVLTLHERESFQLKERGYISIPVEIARNKMYLRTTLRPTPDVAASVKLLVDTGAGMPLLMFSNAHPLVRPPERVIPTSIGHGLGGYLHGFTGRIHQLSLGELTQTGVITYFQELDTTRNLEYLNQRDGLIGNALLHRFHLILDYYGGQIWLKPARYFRDTYVYDRSGMVVLAHGPRLSDFIVQHVLDNSPAAEADIRPGDQIVRIGSTPAHFYTLSDVMNIFQRKPGKKIRLTIQRGEERLKKTIVLRDLI
ncbi:MAG: aspartyl protease family protein [Saprospiraceae bacterium]|nr:aspartyl protease family protein [Saprospiraceae bacterium]MDW8229011.1 aspartyl protease family protein [Saprospiraceae bacterium]